jgi:hypothetical protein
MRLRTTPILAVAGLLVAYSGVALAQTAPPDPAPTQALKGTPSSLEEDVSDLARSVGTSLEEARHALATSGHVVDAIQAEEADRNFGSIWVTYNPYTLHVRLLKANYTQLKRIASAARAQRVRLHLGGRSRAQLMADMETLVATIGKRNLQANSRLDEEAGRFEVTTLDSEAAAVARTVGADVVNAPPVGAKANVAYGGLPMYVWTGTVWQAHCTGGFIARNVANGWTGLITAGHCSNFLNNTRWYNGETPSSVHNEHCGGGWGDSQIIRLTGPVSDVVFTNSPISQYVTHWAQAGGWYNGQPARQGRLNGGHALPVENFYATYVVGTGGGDCNFSYTISHAMRTGGASVDGDSGGPIVLSYNNQWFGAGVVTGNIPPTPQTPGPGTISSFLWGVDRAGWTLCQAFAPC